MIVASLGISRAYDALKERGWPACSPIAAVGAAAMPDGHPQTRLMWAILVREAVARRTKYTGVHPLIDFHIRPGQTWAGIREYMLDCIEIAENHPLNGGFC